MRFLLLLGAVTGYAAPCTIATSACTEWVSVSGQASRLLVYRTYPIETRNEAITRALIVVHGGGRNADGYFRTALAAGFLGGALDDTIIIAPRFASNQGKQSSNGGACHDTFAPNEAAWVCDLERPESWRFGGFAVGSDKLTSYDFVDEILRQLARRQVFPNLKRIVVAGHSGGGIFATHYEMANQVHENLGVPISYVVANAGYAYPDEMRPTANAYPPSAAAPGHLVPIPPDTAAFVPFHDTRSCTGYDNWPYGMKNRTGYSARLTEEQLKKQMAARPTTYLLGEMDLVPLASGDDSSCAIYAQGPTRLARGLAFAKHANESYGAHHQTTVVVGCGHNDRCIFTAEPALPLLFPKP
jgi:pimeloyl-ACP methyl ester carboxylesterase